MKLRLTRLSEQRVEHTSTGRVASVPRRWLHAALVLVAALLLVPVSASAVISTGPATDKSWYWQDPLPQGNTIYAASFADASTGWVAGQGGVVLKTADGGLTWAPQDCGSQNDLTGAAFADAGDGWVAGLAGTIRHTSDGGATWTNQGLGTYAYRAISAADANSAVCVGDKGATVSTIAYTRNGGTNWSYANTASTSQLLGVSMSSPTLGWAVGAAGTILKTTDGGANWTALTSPTTVALNAVAAVKGTTTAYAVGAVNGTTTVLKTTDGTTWSALSMSTALSLNALAVNSDGTQVTIGATNGSIYRSADGGATWTNQTPTLLATAVLRAAAMPDNSHAFVFGDFGTMLSSANGGANWTHQMQGTVSNLQATWFSSANLGWAVGAGGAVLKTTDGGASWSMRSVSTNILYAVMFPDASNGWAVGAAGTILRTTDGGATWAAQTSGTANQLNGEWFKDAYNGVAVGNAGTVLLTSNGGVTWTLGTSGTASNINGVWFADSSNGYLVGAGGLIRHTSDGGVTWTANTSGTAQALNAVRGVSATTAWAVGAAGVALKTTNGGATWTSLTAATGTTQPLYSLYFTDASTGWIGGAYGVVKSTTNGGTTWTSQNADLPTVTTDVNAPVRSIAFPTPGTGFLVGDAGAIRKTATAGATWTSQQYGTVQTLGGVRFTDANDGFAVGNAGVLLTTSDGGQSWAVQKTGSAANFNALAMADSSTGWAVGSGGAIRKTTDGQTWTGQTSNTANILYGVANFGSQRAIAVGAAGIIRYTTDGGTTWSTPATVPTAQQINGVFMTSATTAYAVANYLSGSPDLIKTTDGGVTWAALSPDASLAYSLLSVTFATPSVGYITGNSGVVLKTTDGGATWVRQTTPTTLALNSATFVDASTGWVVGAGGLVLRTSDGGATWGVQQSGTTTALRGTAFTDTNHGWIVGAGGTLLRTTNQTPPVTTLSTAPPAPDGTNGWYTSAPLITLTPNITATTYYSWTSAAGSFAPYTAPVPAPEGVKTLYYYSVDPGANVETVRSSVFKCDYTAPATPVTVSPGTPTTSTVAVFWSPSTDAVSGVARYDVYVDGTYRSSSATTNAALPGLAPNTSYYVTVVAVDNAGLSSLPSTAAWFTTEDVDRTPLSTTISVVPAVPNGANSWFVTVPSISLSTLPNGVAGTILYSWTSASGPYTSFTATITPPAGSSTLYYSSHDLSVPGHADEATQQATFNVDTQTPAAPTVTASATSYSSARLTWPGVLPTPSGIAQYSVYKNGSLLATTTDTLLDAVGLSPSTTYSFAVYAVSSAGTSSTASPVSVTTPEAPLPAPPSIVYAKSPSGYFAFVNWAASTDVVGSTTYHIERSTDGVHYSALATTTGGVNDTQYVDSTLSASQRYWYRVSTIDSRGESAPSDTSTTVWPSISTTTTGPQRPTGLTAVTSSATVVLSWTASPNPGTVGYEVLRADASLATTTVLTPIPIPGTTYFDLSVQNGQTYYYSVVAVDASNTAGFPSLELEANPHEAWGGESPHVINDDSACSCHAAHAATSPPTNGKSTYKVGDDGLIRFAGATKDTACDSCHPPAAALGQFLDPLAKSQHALADSSTPGGQFTCLTCHRPVTQSNEATANLMRTNSSSPCMVVTNVPAGNSFCYTCHGTGSTLPTGDMSGFENSAHNTIAPPPTGAGIVCDTCHESHSSRNEDLNRYSGYMMCVECHNSSQSDPNAPDIWSKLTLNSDANAKHPLLPQDQVNGGRMTCQNCHNTHSSTDNYPLVDPHNPGPTGTWTGSKTDQKSFCFTCHNGSALPTSQETTPWAGAVLASKGATTVADIKDAYQVNVHGFGVPSTGTTVTAYLRPDMGYQYGDVLDCRSCHDPHGTVNNYALQANVSSANGLKTISGVIVSPAPEGGYDLRFFCSTCHLFDSATHDSMAGTSTVTFPSDCTTCHRHVKTNGDPSRGL